MTLHDKEFLREQYRDSSNFDARVALHVRYSTNPQGWNRFIFEHLDLGEDVSILEVGCGPAFLWRANRDEIPDGWRIVASDNSEGMLASARANLNDARVMFLTADAQALPFADASFDCVVANHMLYHVPDLGAALDEFVRVLRPDGKLYAATNGRAHLKEVHDVLDDHARYIGVFGLENGPEKIRSHFRNVVIERYDDEFRVPEVEPIVAYVNSMRRLDPPTEEKLRRHAAEVIERDGVFRIQKDAGLIVGTRR